MHIQGIARKDKRTKNLVKRLRPGDLAIINHQDIDRVSAKALVERRVKAILNASSSISGKYANLGPSILRRAGIPILDNLGEEVFSQIQEGDRIEIRDNQVLKEGRLIAEGEKLDEEEILRRLTQAKGNLGKELEKFVENTLRYVKEEKAILLEETSIPQLDLNISGRQVLVVVRGADYEEDLRALGAYIKEQKPVLMGVDGGADALIEFGYKPDLIIGDMDSVSDQALLCGAKILVHSYIRGRAPGLERVEKLGLKPTLIPLPGLSEDVALLLAYQLGAELIVGVGTHFSLDEFLEKGRQGMASTFLVRLKIGSIFFDAKGVSKLYRGGVSLSLILGLILAALVPIIVVLVTSPLARSFLRLLKIMVEKRLGV